MTKQLDYQKINSEKLSSIEYLLQYSLVIQLYEKGLKQKMIARRLHMGNGTINSILKGIKKTKY